MKLENTIQPQALECADMSALSAGDLSPSSMRDATCLFDEPLNAALLWRRVAKAVKAVTSLRTPNSRPSVQLSH